MIKFDIREFTADEIADVSRYVNSQIQQSVLSSLFILTEEVIKKTKAFVATYRIITASRDYVKNNVTKEKLTRFLNISEKAYNEIYPLVLDYDNSVSEYNKSHIHNKLVQKVIDYNENINDFINKFIVFAEKLELTSIDTVSGIKSDVVDGENIIEKSRQFIKE